MKKFDEHLRNGEVVSNSLWEYENLLQTNNIIWVKDRSLYIDWDLSFNPHFEFNYYVNGINEELKERFRRSSLSYKGKVIMTLGSSWPILKFDVDYFIENWECLVDFSCDASLIWTEDFQLIMEFNGETGLLFSNFLI